MLNVKCKMLNLIFAIAIIFAVCWNVQEVKAQTDNLLYIKEDVKVKPFTIHYPHTDTISVSDTTYTIDTTHTSDTTYTLDTNYVVKDTTYMKDSIYIFTAYFDTISFVCPADFYIETIYLQTDTNQIDDLSFYYQLDELFQKIKFIFDTTTGEVVFSDTLFSEIGYIAVNIQSEPRFQILNFTLNNDYPVLKLIIFTDDYKKQTGLIQLIFKLRRNFSNYD